MPRSAALKDSVRDILFLQTESKQPANKRQQLELPTVSLVTRTTRVGIATEKAQSELMSNHSAGLK